MYRSLSSRNKLSWKYSLFDFSALSNSLGRKPIISLFFTLINAQSTGFESTLACFVPFINHQQAFYSKSYPKNPRDKVLFTEDIYSSIMSTNFIFILSLLMLLATVTFCPRVWFLWRVYLAQVRPWRGGMQCRQGLWWRVHEILWR